MVCTYPIPVYTCACSFHVTFAWGRNVGQTRPDERLSFLLLISLVSSFFASIFHLNVSKFYVYLRSSSSFFVFNLAFVTRLTRKITQDTGEHTPLNLQLRRRQKSVPIFLVRRFLFFFNWRFFLPSNLSPPTDRRTATDQASETENKRTHLETGGWRLRRNRNQPNRTDEHRDATEHSNRRRQRRRTTNM